MGILKKFIKVDGAKYRAIKRFWWADRVLAVGEVIDVEDPALARELCGAGRLEPVDDDARDHLRRPAKWVEQPRTTAVSPRGAGVFSRQAQWGPLE
jgi:hypothetical protein